MQVGDLVEYTGARWAESRGSLASSPRPMGIVLDVDVVTDRDEGLIWVRVHWFAPSVYELGWHTTRHLTVISSKAKVN